MDAILIHGMGRTPAAMSILAVRLRAGNIRPHLFGYSVTFEKWEECVQRYKKFIERRAKTKDYIIVGHYRGTFAWNSFDARSFAAIDPQTEGLFLSGPPNPGLQGGS